MKLNDIQPLMESESKVELIKLARTELKISTPGDFVEKLFKKAKTIHEMTVEEAVALVNLKGSAANYLQQIIDSLKTGGDAYNLWWALTQFLKKSDVVSNEKLTLLRDAAGTLSSQADGMKEYLNGILAVYYFIHAMVKIRNDDTLEGSMAQAILKKLGVKP